MTRPARPLDGITVVTVEQAVAAPFATRQLADQGARVIKVERPGRGDFARHYDRRVLGNSSAFVWLNRGKQSLTLDFAAPEGRAVLEDLVAGADVFVQNLSPSAAERAGLHPAAVLERHPRVIPCAVSGYGSGGPLRDAKAYDLLVQGETGILSLTGTPSEMAKVGVSIADIAAGMYAYSGVLAALLLRERTGRVLPVETSLFDGLVEWLAHPLYFTYYGGSAPVRMGVDHPMIAPYGAFATGDGRQVLLAVQNDAEWRRFCAIVLADPALADDADLATNSARVEHRIALDARIAASLARHDGDTVRALLDEAGVANARITDIADLAEHPQLVERGRWLTTPVPGGEIRTVHPPGLPGPPRDDFGAVPEAGAHTDTVLADLRQPGEIARLHELGVVSTDAKGVRP